jgi:hypothetical protein
MEKELYRLRIPKDLRPLFGLVDRQERCEDPVLLSDRSYNLKYRARNALLWAYNFSIPAVVIVIDSELAKMLCQ